MRGEGKCKELRGEEGEEGEASAPLPVPLPVPPSDLRGRIFAALELRPYENPVVLARELGVAPYTIQALMRSDSFREMAISRMTNGQLLAKARASEVAISALNQLERIMAPESEAPFAVKLRAAEVTLTHSEVISSEGKNGNSREAPPVSVAISISPGDLLRARGAMMERAAAITIEAERKESGDVKASSDPAKLMEFLSEAL